MTRAPITHRIVEELPGPAYRTKGDANRSIDARIVTTADIRAQERDLVPVLGRPMLMTTTQRGLGAMAEATETLDLTNVLGVLRRWQRVALSSRDPEAHRRMLRKAGLLLAGEPVATEPWDVTKVRLGL
ncbi:MAG TPA: DUF6247 family protein [Acidimicrobiales bacterium]